MEKKFVIINICNSRSTGNIAKEIGNSFRKYTNFVPNYIWLKRTSVETTDNEFFASYEKEKLIYRIYYKLFGRFLIKNVFGDGFCRFFKTLKIIKIIKKINPIFVNIHNVHGEHINLKILCKFLGRRKIPTFFTLHDCWLFTGCCPHFVASGCKNYYLNECRNCRYLNKYPSQERDIAHKVYNKKQQSYAKLFEPKFICVSNYLLTCLNKSFLSSYESVCIRNGIDISIFNIKKNNYDKKIQSTYGEYVLAVSDTWNEDKGDKEISELSFELQKVGKKLLIIGRNFDKPLSKLTTFIPYVKEKKYLAALYRNAQVFVNPSHQESFPTVNLESICCGTPIICYKNGGGNETINEHTGCLCENLDSVSFINEVIAFNPDKFSRNKISSYGRKHFDKKICYYNYVQFILNSLKKYE